MSLTARNELNIELKGLQGEAEGLKIPSTTNFKTIARYKSITDTSLRRWETENLLLGYHHRCKRQQQKEEETRKEWRRQLD